MTLATSPMWSSHAYPWGGASLRPRPRTSTATTRRSSSASINQVYSSADSPIPGTTTTGARVLSSTSLSSAWIVMPACSVKNARAVSVPSR
jgi:hypothetical protein